ncbi:MAG TPA: flagellar filament capping protein FliD [Solirubrobacteraceae bacterium]|nr:flagellar filament capping protein FliD [Solirubrobacteraceae bacterium]
MSGVSSSGAAALNITGLESGLNVSEIVSAELSVQREPITRMTDEQTTAEGQREALQSLQSSLTQLAFDAQELASPTLFDTNQGITSSNASQVTASATSGEEAAIGGYELEVTQLANSAQRTFTFTSPASAQTLEIDGEKFEVAAEESLTKLADAINADSKATVYASAVNGETLVLSTRTTGATGGEFIKVTGAEGVLGEVAEKAKEGRDAQYTLDGVAGTSTSNTLSEAIPGVTLELQALTTATGPVTVDVQPPAADPSAIVKQVESFVGLYNSTISAIEKQTSTKPPANPQIAAELKTGTLFGDSDLTGLLNAMRQAIYDPVGGLPAEMSSLASIGVSTGPPAGTATYSQASVEGQLQLNTGELEAAVRANPEGVQQMLSSWAKGFQETVNAVAGPGGALEGRITGDSEQVTELSSRITSLNEMLAIRQKTLQEQFTAMEAALAKSRSEGEYLATQLSSLSSSSSSSSSSSGGL